MNAKTYHKLTSYNRYRMSPHSLDWGNTPALYKTYPSLPSIPLQPVKTLPEVSLWEIGEHKETKASRTALGIQELSTSLMLACGITANRRYGTQTHLFRSSPSAGALYPSEVYVAPGQVAGLPSGLYHYNVSSSGLTRLRKGSQIAQVTKALTARVGQAPAVSFLISGIFFRSAWKYRARAFRYVLLDAGHLIENLVLALRTYGYRLSVHYDFDDDAMAGFLGIDETREVCLGCINVYPGGPEERPGAETQAADISRLGREIIDASRVSPAEISYTEIHQVYDAGKIATSDATRAVDPCPVVDEDPEAWFPLGHTTEVSGAGGYANSVMQRRSRRNFIQYPIQSDHAMRFLEQLCQVAGQGADEGEIYAGFMTSGFIGVNIEGFDPGFYLLDTLTQQYGHVCTGPSGEVVARVCLDQQWLKNGAAHFVFMANLSEIDLRAGARGYRYALLNAGRAGQRIYLTATALGYGACGIGALYDDEASRMLSLNDDSALLYLVSVGAVKK